jgi:hypothetical protein
MKEDKASMEGEAAASIRQGNSNNWADLTGRPKSWDGKLFRHEHPSSRQAKNQTTI